nr:unnamed protein product [Callosobruchus chinensis]
MMSADSDFRTETRREGPTMHIRDLPCNRPKIDSQFLPYDHSGLNYNLWMMRKDQIISCQLCALTQGPLHSTRDDFWRMVWESNSRAIIMLTRCVGGQGKCDHYWPYDTMPAYYGDISVQILNESRYPDWNGETQRVVRHFHFSTWPDFGVPNPPHTLTFSESFTRCGKKESGWCRPNNSIFAFTNAFWAVLEGKDLSSSTREIHENKDSKVVSQFISRCKKLLFCGSGKGGDGATAQVDPTFGDIKR